MLTLSKNTDTKWGDYNQEIIEIQKLGLDKEAALW